MLRRGDRGGARRRRCAQLYHRWGHKMAAADAADETRRTGVTVSDKEGGG